MMIVTHEMNFARAISNRIFYMDEGGIYEEGTPEQIFEHPQRENTRRFIKKLKVLELNIESRDYDFLGMAGQIEVYCNKNQIPPKTASRIQLTFEETAQILVSLLESPRIQAVCEYSEATETAEWTISYSGERLDVINNGDELALAVLKGITEEMKYNWNENAELPNQLSLKIQQA
jgi:polar amino acid transport system ATP-binding protein